MADRSLVVWSVFHKVRFEKFSAICIDWPQPLVVYPWLNVADFQISLLFGSASYLPWIFIWWFCDLAVQSHIVFIKSLMCYKHGFIVSVLYLALITISINCHFLSFSHFELHNPCRKISFFVFSNKFQDRAQPKKNMACRRDARSGPGLEEFIINTAGNITPLKSMDIIFVSHAGSI